MLTHILDHLEKLKLEELRELNRHVCHALKGLHAARAQRLAAKFAPGGHVLYMGQKLTVRDIGERHLTTTNGAVVPIAHCRPFSK